jgi:hypothetical protein
MPRGPAVELPGAVDIPWRVPKPRPKPLWCQRGKTGPWWVRNEPLPPLWCRGDWDYSPFWVHKTKARRWDR